MSARSTTVMIKVPPHVVYIALKDLRVMEHLPNFFKNAEVKISRDVPDKELEITTRGAGYVIRENYSFTQMGNETQVNYTVELPGSLNPDGKQFEFFIPLVISSVVHSLFMLETGYVNGRLDSGK